MNNLVGLTLTRSTGTTLLMYTVVRSWLGKAGDPSTRDNFSPYKRGLRVTDSKYRESRDRFEKSKTLKLCLKNAFREFSSKILFRFSKNLT